MITWTVTMTSTRRVHTIVGSATTAHDAHREMIIATASLIERGGDDHPRYELSVGEQLVAIIQTGDTATGAPDHAGAASLLARIDNPADDPFLMEDHQN